MKQFDNLPGNRHHRITPHLAQPRTGTWAFCLGTPGIDQVGNKTDFAIKVQKLSSQILHANDENDIKQVPTARLASTSSEGNVAAPASEDSPWERLDGTRSRVVRVSKTTKSALKSLPLLRGIKSMKNQKVREYFVERISSSGRPIGHV